MSVNTSYANITDSVWTVRHFCSTWSEHGAEYMHGRLILQPAGENNHNLERKGPRPYVELHGCCWLLLEPPSSLVPSLPHLSSRVFITAAEAEKQPRSSMYGRLLGAESSWQFELDLRGTLLVATCCCGGRWRRSCCWTKQSNLWPRTSTWPDDAWTTFCERQEFFQRSVWWCLGQSTQSQPGTVDVVYRAVVVVIGVLGRSLKCAIRPRAAKQTRWNRPTCISIRNNYRP